MEREREKPSCERAFISCCQAPPPPAAGEEAAQHREAGRGWELVGREAAQGQVLEPGDP